MKFKLNQFIVGDDGTLIAEASELALGPGDFPLFIQIDNVIYIRGDADVTDGGQDIAGYNYTSVILVKPLNKKKLLIIND